MPVTARQDATALPCEVVLAPGDGHAAGHDERDERLRHQIALARFGELALRSEDLDEILTEACRLVAEALCLDLAKVVELQSGGRTLLVRAGIGWASDVVGVVTLPLDEASPESLAITTGEPVISPDIHQETRFQYPDFLRKNGVQAVANVAIIGSKDHPEFGLLQVDSRTPREFTSNDVIFLRGYANLLAAAVDRLRVLGETRERSAELERRVAEAKAAAERQAFLARELDHRAKNMLAVVHAVLHLTRADDIPSFIRIIDGRVAALARAQTLLAADRWSGADLHAVLRGEFDSYVDGEGPGPRVTLRGPPVALPAGAAQPFSMAVHELATNAVKYGGLSTPSGHLDITWHREGPPGDFLRMRWTESGGPRVKGPPDRQGFGSRLLSSTLRSQLRGTLLMTWEATGIVCDLALPLSASFDKL
ncbi:GAF domain-containing protein [Roseomonas nepalensis]|uniref:histidine kinase n=1 Tax=Muricoccus nepalensis TaxID=1854500 RepID=A0A502FWV4_9PROT|nr:HWE histidine kinase domain-containing protein [Roseomonas nepalensis]TPG53423.1 GAF domain-containing protein [Roseomonas nepalensis]